MAAPLIPLWAAFCATTFFLGWAEQNHVPYFQDVDKHVSIQTPTYLQLARDNFGGELNKKGV